MRKRTFIEPTPGGDTAVMATADDERVHPPGGTPMQVPTHSSRMWRLRFTVTDEPGRLAAAAAALADLGVNILSLDFHVVSATEVIDEATVSLPPWLDVPAVEFALHGTGAVDVWAVPIQVHELEDIATRVLRLAAGVIAAGSDEQSLCDAIAELVDAELVSTRRISASADRAESGTPGGGLVRFGRDHVKRLPARAGAWTMAIPDDPIDPGATFVAVRRSSPFTSTEAARVRALLQVAAVTDRLGTSAGDRRVSEVRIDRLTPAHLDEVEELHRRCSAASRYRRYFSPMPVVRSDVIAALLDQGSGRIALGAWIGDVLVGMGNGCPTDAGGPGGCVELALLVEDDHQGRGIGTSLADELVAVSSRSGANDFVVLTLPENQAMARIVRRIAHAPRIDRDGDNVTFRFTGAAIVDRRSRGSRRVAG